MMIKLVFHQAIKKQYTVGLIALTRKAKAVDEN